jgi:glycosyltransferase involved in cell wall biosynthesis
MRIVFVHERYQQAGGEDPIFAAESDLMEEFGHSVVRYTDDNARVADMKPWTVAATTVWSRRAHKDLRALFRSFRPDVAHFHNTFPLISPSGYYAARAEGVPVVQTIHNYRLICPSATLFRDGRPCVDCVGRLVPWPGVKHACYRDSRPASLVVAGMLSTHRLLQTWNRLVHVYIAPSEFARQQLMTGGLRGDRIVIKPNFINPDPGVGAHDGRFALFTGRLAIEKGLPTLLSAWQRLDGAFPLKIVGDGPLAAEVEAASKSIPGVEWLGRRPKDEVVRLMQEASFLVVPSTWYEGFPMVIAEAFSTGLPVMASDLGGVGEIVGSSAGGVVFEADAPEALASKVDWARSHPAEILALGRAARLEYEERYTLEKSYRMHLEIYARARATRARSVRRRARVH